MTDLSNNAPSYTPSDINIIPLSFAPSISFTPSISYAPSISFAPSIAGASSKLDPVINLPLTNYNKTFNTYSVKINDLTDSDFDTKNGINFQNSETKYVMTPNLTGSYTISFDIFVTSYNSLTSNYIFNQGVLYAKGQGYLGTGLGLTIHLTSPTNLAVNMYETSIGGGKVHYIPVSNFIIHGII